MGRLTAVALLVVAFIAGIGPGAAAQPVTIGTAGGALGVRAPEFSFIEREVLDRLRDGRTVRVDVELAVLSQPGGIPVASARHSFTLSFDLWEERFAVTRLGTPARSVAHLEADDAEAWCVAQLAVPVGEMGALGRDAPFWIRLESRVPDARISSDDADAVFTLRRLIEWLSRRGTDAVFGRSVEAGPFRLPG
jgi:hypothetical protein